MIRALALALLVGATPLLADDKAPAPPEPAKPRPPLKLRLEETTSGGAPRVTFTPREGGAATKPNDSLPALGGQPSPAFDQRAPAGTKGSPYPPDSTGGR